MIDELLYDPKETVKEKAIKILLDIRTVVQNDDKEYIMKLTLRLAHDPDEGNRISALKILNEFAQDMGQTICECYIIPEFKSLGMDEVSKVRIEVAKNMINISVILIVIRKFNCLKKSRKFSDFAPQDRIFSAFIQNLVFDTFW